jgi:hypothetical protein
LKYDTLCKQFHEQATDPPHFKINTQLISNNIFRRVNHLPFSPKFLLMSKDLAEHRKHAAKHNEKAAEHHHEAAKHYEAGDHKTAGHHAHSAHAHHLHAEEHAKNAAKHHAEHHAK